MIVVVEGASAAGKTTWCRRHAAGITIDEGAPPGTSAPDRSDLDVWLHFWQAANEWRWREALRVESSRGLAVCDTDPFKLHYTWCLWQAGFADASEWEAARDLAREAFRASRLGIADLVLFEDVEESTLRTRRDSDRDRSRRNFDTHVRLAGPLRRWYEAVAELDPGRVLWALPEVGLSNASGSLGPRGRRGGTETFDQLMENVRRKARPT